MRNKNLFESFKNAFKGIFHAVASERNLRIHIGIIGIILISGIILKLDYVRWSILFISIGLVIVCELINTSIERLTDMVTNEYSEEARKVKDISAAAVLFGSMMMVIISIIVLYRPVMNFFKF